MCRVARRPYRSMLSRFLAFMLLLPPLVTPLALTPVAAATDHVTTCSGNIATMGSLPNVVASASAGDTVVFDLDCPPGAPITLTHSIGLFNNLTVDGSGHNVAVDGGGAVGVFRVSSGVSATINGLTIQHGVIAGTGNNGRGI